MSLINIVLNKIYLVRRLVIFTAVILSMASCDPSYCIDVYVKNTTPHTVLLHAIPRDTTDSTQKHIVRINDTITIKSGEQILLNSDCALGIFEREDIPSVFKSYYPYGLKMMFENEEEVVYLPDSINTDFHSPYDLNSFFFHKRDEDNMATYYIYY